MFALLLFVFHSIYFVIKNSLLCSGDLVRWSHLFSFRTESLSTATLMVLLLRESKCRQNKEVKQQKKHLNQVFFCSLFYGFYDILQLIWIGRSREN